MPTIRNSSKAIGMASLLRPSGEVQSWDHRYEGWIRFHVLRKWVEAVFFFLKGVVTRSQKVPLYSWEHTKPFLHKEKYFPLFRSDMCGTPLVPGFPFHWDSCQLVLVEMASVVEAAYSPVDVWFPSVFFIQTKHSYWFPLQPRSRMELLGEFSDVLPSSGSQHPQTWTWPFFPSNDQPLC